MKITFRPGILAKALCDYCTKTGKSPCEVIREALAAFLKANS